ncbi:MAG: prolyl oligopeptidase family serine peptidase [Wenzhouxiangellaceae bacterium]|nr:prolyl oligopeptidase family serine peptidase [Wenzhouxiangellaceae bacterium]
MTVRLSLRSSFPSLHRSTPITATAAFLIAALLAAPAFASDDALTLNRIMADPDWIGPPVEAAWWQLDGDAYVARIKRRGSEQRDLLLVDARTGEAQRLEPADHAGLDGPDPTFDRERRRALTVRDGNLFLRHLDNGVLRQLTGDGGPLTDPSFSSDGRRVVFRRNRDWWSLDLETGVTRPAADLRMEDAPHEPGDDALVQDQLRYFRILSEELEDERERHRERIEAGREDPTRGPAPWYLGDDEEIADSWLSPDERWMLLAVRTAGSQEGRNDHMPKFVTRSGYVEVEDVRTLVGREPPAPQRLWLLDLERREKHELDLAALEGRHDDPLADLKREQDIEPHDEDDPRPVRIADVEWHPGGQAAAVMIHSIDNKDRWLVSVEPGDPDVRLRHRLTDPAWINWAFNEFGWVPGSRTLWLLSEETGYSHLYLVPRKGEARAVTGGDFEVFDVTFTGPKTALALANRGHPTRYDLFRIDTADGRMEPLTSDGGIESYAWLPGDDRILLRESSPYLPPQAAIRDPSARRLVARTDTRTDEYRAIDWQQPEFVGVESTHGAEGPIWSKFYPARGDDAVGPDGRRPAVLFVHGAGYTQNTHLKFPYYFREQMFHNLLTQRGYHVLDMDYRASRGYGRDWRTAIYRHMGEPELQDLVDGVRWLVEEHGVDPARVGVYGGSYGGFMTFMALFKEPEIFAAGASLRPVTDWTHYNHGYTSNILNTPQVDPEAYRRSSPIEFVEGLDDPLLISHGMLDDNVFYKDSIRLVQRLIEMEKTDWELASYPLEPHGYVHASSWLDQYRRILGLFENTIGTGAVAE